MVTQNHLIDDTICEIPVSEYKERVENYLFFLYINFENQSS